MNKKRKQYFTLEITFTNEKKMLSAGSVIFAMRDVGFFKSFYEWNRRKGKIDCD